MLGVLIVSHGDMAAGLKNSCEMIAGKHENLMTLALTEDGIEPFAKKLNTLLIEMKEKYQDIVILADLVNATPFTQSGLAMGNDSNIHLIAGVNLATTLAFVLSAEGYQDFDKHVRQIVSEVSDSIVLYEAQIIEEDEVEL